MLLIRELMFEEILVGITSIAGILGGMVAYVGLKAFRRRKDNSFLLASTGFGLIASSTVFGTIACVFLNAYDAAAHIVQSAGVAAGLFAIVRSISSVKRDGTTLSVTPIDRVDYQSET